MSMNKANGYLSTLDAYSYSISGISRIQSDLPGTTVEQSTTNSIGMKFTYGDSVITGYTTGSDGTWTAFGGVHVYYPSGGTITASDWEPVYSEGTVKLTTTPGEYLRGECTQGGVHYYRPSAPYQQYFVAHFECAGNESQTFEVRINITEQDGEVFIYVPDSEMNIYFNNYFDNLEWDYNRLYSSTKTFRCVVEPDGESDTAGSCRMVWTTTIEDPSFFKASLLENTWNKTSVVSNHDVRLTVRNPLKLSYSGYVATPAGDIVQGTDFSKTGSADAATYDYQTITPSSKSDWLATRMGYSQWLDYYRANARITYSLPTVVPSYLQNAYILEAAMTTSNLNIQCNDDFVTDFTSASIVYTTDASIDALKSLIIDNEKTVVTVRLPGVKVPYYTFQNNRDVSVYFELVLSAGGNTQYYTGVSTTFANLINKASVSGDYLVLDSSTLWNFSIPTNLNLTYGETALDLEVKLSTRWFYNLPAYARGIRTDTGLKIYPYLPPQITIFEAARYKSGSSSTYTRDDTNGTVAGMDATFSCTPLNNINVLTTHNVRAAKTDTPTTYLWQNQAINSGIRLYISNPSMPTDSSYVVTLTLIDGLKTTVTSTYTIAAGKCFLDFKAGGDGMAIGKASEKNGLEINFETDFYDDVRFGTGATTTTVDFTNTQVSGLKNVTFNAGGMVAFNGTVDLSQANVQGLSFNEAYSITAPIGDISVLNMFSMPGATDGREMMQITGFITLKFSNYIDTTYHSRARYTGTIDLSALSGVVLSTTYGVFGTITPRPTQNQLLTGSIMPLMYAGAFTLNSSTKKITLNVDFYVDTTRVSGSTDWTVNWNTVSAGYTCTGIECLAT